MVCNRIGVLGQHQRVEGAQRQLGGDARADSARGQQRGVTERLGGGVRQLVGLAEGSEASDVLDERRKRHSEERLERLASAVAQLVGGPGVELHIAQAQAQPLGVGHAKDKQRRELPRRLQRREQHGALTPVAVEHSATDLLVQLALGRLGRTLGTFAFAAHEL